MTGKQVPSLWKSRTLFFVEVNQSEMFPDTEATEDTDFFGEDLPPLPATECNNKLEEPCDEINSGNTALTFSAVYVSEVVTCRAEIERESPIGRQKQTLDLDNYR